jgi:hypothetical protein
MRKKLFGCALVAAVLTVFPSSASADDTRCVGLLSGTFDNVVVPRNADCVLSGSTVRGNVTARRGSSLFSSFNQIAGNVEGDGPRWVGSQTDRIGGDFALTGATGPGFSIFGLSVNVFVCGTSLTSGNIAVEKSRNGTVAVGSPNPICLGNDVAQGNILVQENVIPAPELLTVERNTVGGNVQVFKNRGEGLKTVMANVVHENLQCKENDPPFLGGPNVANKAEDQCF